MIGYGMFIRSHARSALRCGAIVLSFIAVCESAALQDDLERTIEDLEREARAAERKPIIDERRPPASDDPRAFVEGTAIALAPLLREGSILADALGRPQRNRQTGSWEFYPDGDGQESAKQPRFILLPCRPLQEMERSIERAGPDTSFRVTGRVLVYEGRNYLLALSASRVERYEPDVPPPSDSTDADEDQEQDQVAANAPAEDIIAQLKRDVPLARGLDIESADDPVETADLPARETAALPEGTVVMARRGSIMPGPAGGWRFVFHADATGLADPPMTLLPCLLLEQIRRDVQRDAEVDSVLLTGEVHSYRGRNFLLPTMYRVERHRRNLQ